MAARSPLDQATPVSPAKLSHVVLRVKDLKATTKWYQDVLNARIIFEAGEAGCGLTYDGEHHRIALVQMTPEEVARVEAVGDVFAQVDAQRRHAGLEHFAFTYESLGDLLANYKRLKARGILPTLTINHGPTTSMYYMDPNGVAVELQHDNMPMDQAFEFLNSPPFQNNQVGYPFDPEDLCARFEAGEPLRELVTAGWKEVLEEA